MKTRLITACALALLPVISSGCATRTDPDAEERRERIEALEQRIEEMERQQLRKRIEEQGTAPADQPPG